VVVPADAPETAQVIRAVARAAGPFYVRLPRGAAPDVTPPDVPFQLGRAVTLREGEQVSLVACGLMVDVALRAAEALAAAGISARVINASSIKPLDVAVLKQAAEETGALVTVEEHSVIGGLGSAVCEAVSALAPVPILRVGIQDQFGQSGPAAALLEHYGLTPSAVAARAREAIALKG
jgi:transketolase